MNNDPYRILPPASDEERAELKRSIESVGLQQSVMIDEHGHIIDGHERRDICEELGIDWLAGADVRAGLSDDQKKAIAIDLNLWRRQIHLSLEQRNELVEIYLIAHPELSENQVADLFGVSQPTVNRIKKRLIQMNKLSPATSTIGKDGVRRKVGSRMIVKNKSEYDKLMPSVQEVANEVAGLIRRPQLFVNKAKRKDNLTKIGAVERLPANISIDHCDFRSLNVEPQSADLVLTDVVWCLDARNDWTDLAALASKWLKPDGVFATLIGQLTLFELVDAVKDFLVPLKIIALKLSEPRRSWKNIECWRPLIVFGKDESIRDAIKCPDMIDVPPFEKDYHDWQQSVEVAEELVKRLSLPGQTIVEPHLGTGTNAIAVCRVGQGRQLIGCDIDPAMVRIARHRLATEVEDHDANRCDNTLPVNTVDERAMSQCLASIEKSANRGGQATGICPS